MRQCEPGGTAKSDQHKIFSKQLADQASTLRAQRGAHRHLVLSRLPAGQQKVGDVRHADQQNEADGGEQHPERLLEIAESLLFERSHLYATSLVGRWVTLREASRDRIHLGLRLGEGYAGLEPRKNPESAGAACVEIVCTPRHMERSPELG